MSVFLGLFERLIPLYGLVALGYVSGRFVKVSKESVALLVIYVISPMVVFLNVSQIGLEAKYFLVPGLMAGFASLTCFVFFHLSGLGFRSPAKNVIAFASANANSGYFGLPVAMILFGQEITGIWLLFSLGFILFENTYGFYMMARGQHTAREALLRIFKLPALYAFVAAIVANFAGLEITGVYADFSAFFRGAYALLGMMLIGMGVAEMRKLTLDWKFLVTVHAGKFLFWPALAFGFVALDRAFLHLYDTQVHPLILLLGCCPVAANTVAFSTVLKAEPEKASVAVLLSTAFALLFIPLVVGIFF